MVSQPEHRRFQTQDNYVSTSAQLRANANYAVRNGGGAELHRVNGMDLDSLTPQYHNTTVHQTINKKVNNK